MDEETANIIAGALQDDITEWSVERLDELCLYVAAAQGWEVEPLGLSQDAEHGFNLEEEMNT